MPASGCHACGVTNPQDPVNLTCTKCKNKYHTLCVQIDQETLEQLTEVQLKNWICPVCTCSLPKSGNSETAVSSSPARLFTYTPGSNVNTIRGSAYAKPKQKLTENNPSPDHTLDLVSEIRQLREHVCRQSQEMGLLRQDLLEVKQQLSSITQLSEKIQTFDLIITEQAVEIKLLRETLTASEATINAQEQVNLRNELEIAGIPEIESENPYHLAITTAKKLGVDLLDTDIDFVHRTGPKKKPFEDKSRLPRTIALRLIRQSKRDELVKAAKSRRNLSSENLAPGPVSKVYVNERLTKANRLLFRESRKRATHHNFRFCWISNGRIHVRQAERKPAIQIKSYEDLDKVVGPAQ